MFFVVSTLLAIPSLLLLAWLQQRGHFKELGPTRVVKADD
jgi:PAT family beta-lactamase induction signal transducer AmpG